MNVIVILIVFVTLGTFIKGLVPRLDDLGYKRTSGDYPIYSIAEIGNNTEKNLKDSRRLAITQTRVEKPSANDSEKNSI